MKHVNVIGAGLAGCEAAWQLASREIDVVLYEMKPIKKTLAHHFDTFAELVCSNSLRSNQLENAAGLLKEELRRLGSLIMKCADQCRIPAGGALAVDRVGFSECVTQNIINNKNIKVINTEIEELPDDAITIIATGPLTSDKFSDYIKQIIGDEYLFFFDAAAPIVEYSSIDMSKAFKASRYGRGEDDYINCPMDKEQYEAFWHELVNAETAQIKSFEETMVFEGCMPIEVMARRGIDTLRFGPLKPVGIIDPATGREPFAVVQLRQDNARASLYNMVGFQTHLKWPEQKRVFRMIPGLENAEFARYGVMHRNTFINSPKLLDSYYCLKKNNKIFFAGQITGVEGYVESTASGIVAGINAAMDFLGRHRIDFPDFTATGALAKYVSNPSVKDFQPMNINYGIINNQGIRIKEKRKKNLEISKKALETIGDIACKITNEYRTI